MSIARAAMVLLALVCAGCSGGSRYASHWDGRRGYNGSGDYGYDLAASRSYQARAARSYPVPGTRDDPWGPYIHEAATRFQVPERWIRAVMRQESGGRLYEKDGSLMTSSTGAMGLMQVMPRTYDMLRRRYGLADDPYDPHDNILAGTAYIREMYDRYGSPAFLAAYNAGPERVEAYLSGASPLPEETVNYLASVTPRLGSEAAGGGGGGQDDATRQFASMPDDPSARAFDGGGLVTARAPTGSFTPSGRAAPGRSWVYSSSGLSVVPVAAASTRRGDWGIQVGAYADRLESENALAAARARGGELLAGTQPAITSVQRSGVLYRARLVGLSAEDATTACARLSGQGMDCFTVPPL